MYKRQYKYQFAGSSSSPPPLTPFSTFSDGPSQQFVQTKKPIKKSCLMKRALSRWTASTAKIKP